MRAGVRAAPLPRQRIADELATLVCGVTRLAVAAERRWLSASRRTTRRSARLTELSRLLAEQPRALLLVDVLVIARGLGLLDCRIEALVQEARSDQRVLPTFLERHRIDQAGVDVDRERLRIAQFDLRLLLVRHLPQWVPRVVDVLVAIAEDRADQYLVELAQGRPQPHLLVRSQPVVVVPDIAIARRIHAG